MSQNPANFAPGRFPGLKTPPPGARLARRAAKGLLTALWRGDKPAFRVRTLAGLEPGSTFTWLEEVSHA